MQQEKRQDMAVACTRKISRALLSLSPPHRWRALRQAAAAENYQANYEPPTTAQYTGPM